jgi:hypothetical protein
MFYCKVLFFETIILINAMVSNIVRTNLNMFISVLNCVIYLGSSMSMTKSDSALVETQAKSPEESGVRTSS